MENPREVHAAEARVPIDARGRGAALGELLGEMSSYLQWVYKTNCASANSFFMFKLF